MTRGISQISLTIVVLVFTVMSNHPVDAGENVFFSPPARKTKFFKIKNKKNAFVLDTEFEKEKRKLDSSDTSYKRSRVVIKEALEMDFEGTVYHPRFMNFDLFLEMSPQQDKEKSESVAGDNKFRNSYLSDYSLTSNFLQEKPYNFTLFMDKQRKVQNRDFFERRTIDNSTYGARVNLRKIFLPLSLSFYHSYEDINRSFRPKQDFEEETFTVHADPVIKPLGQTWLDYARNKFLRQEAGISDQKGTSDDFTLSARRHFGDSRDKALTSFLRYYSLQGTGDSRDMTLSESFTIKHNRSLDTLYQYNFSDRSSQDIDISEHALGFGGRHRLYESLVTSFDLKGSFLESTSFDERIAGFSFSEDYRKKMGQALLRIGAGFSCENKNRKARDTFLYIVDETHTLTDGTVVYLNELRLDRSTIIVTNITGTTIYTRDTDYQIIEHSSGRIELRRITGGSISNGEEVIVDYIVRHNPSFSSVSLGNNLRFGLGFWDESLRFYYTLKQQRYPDVKGERNLILEKVDDMIFGCELRLGGMNLSADYEDYETDLTPYNALRLREGIEWSVSPRANFTLRLSQDYVNLSDGEYRNYEVRGKYSLRFSPSAVCSAESGYRWQKGQDIDLTNFTTRITYRVCVGKLFFDTGYEYEKERSLGDYLQNHYIYTKLKRSF